MNPDSKTILVGLAHDSLLRVNGADAISFLQGQLSTDISKLTPKQSQFSSWSNAKGRVVTLLRLLRVGDDIVMSLPENLKAPVLKRLSMYVLRSKVSISDAGMDMASFGLAGHDAPALLATAGIPVSIHVNDTTATGGIHAIRLAGPLSRYALYGVQDDIFSLQQKLFAAGALQADESRWALLKILAAEPTVYAETSEHFVAQMLNLDGLGAIDFKKGCYIGQEIIARAHYRGAVKRHMRRANSRSAEPIKPGAILHAAGTEQAVAEVVDAQVDAQGIMQLLVVVQDDHRDTALNTASGDTVSLLPEPESGAA